MPLRTSGTMKGLGNRESSGNLGGVVAEHSQCGGTVLALCHEARIFGSQPACSNPAKSTCGSADRRLGVWRAESPRCAVWSDKITEYVRRGLASEFKSVRQGSVTKPCDVP